eukprot:PITA_25166
MEVGAYKNLCKTSGSVTIECIQRTNVILATKFCGKPTSFGSSRRVHLRSYVSKSLCGRSKILKVIARDEGAPGILNGSKQQNNDIANSNNGVSLAEDVFILGRLVQGNSVCRQHFVIRSYEVGADMNESIETLMNHLQETALSHARVTGLNADGTGNTQEMSRLNLIWVITRVQVHVERYPSWGDIVEIDTWMTRSGKNSLRRDWHVRDYKTGYILAKATSTWVMMNRKTRRLSKFPEEVKEEISPHCLESPLTSPVIDQRHYEKIDNLDDDTADYSHSDLKPKWTDLDANGHVNNVKYIGWIMESVPDSILETQQLAKMTLEYRRECEQSDVLQALTSLEKNGGDAIDPNSAPSYSCTCEHSLNACNHLLRLQENGSQILRGRTEWKPKANSK